MLPLYYDDKIIKGWGGLSYIFKNNLSVRAKSPFLFFYPSLSLPLFGIFLPIPFIKFRREPSGVAHWLGPPLSLDKKVEIITALNHDSFFMWSAREIATNNIVRCPVHNYIMDADESCDTQCFFTKWFRDTWGFYPNNINEPNSNNGENKNDRGKS